MSQVNTEDDGKPDQGATPVFKSQKNGKAKTSEKTAPKRYTGRRPKRSESAP